MYLVVCGAGAIGIAVIAFGPWRRGVTIMGLGLLLAGAMRLVLSDHEAGMLRVRRGRFVDRWQLRQGLELRQGRFSWQLRHSRFSGGRLIDRRQFWQGLQLGQGVQFRSGGGERLKDRGGRLREGHL